MFDSVETSLPASLLPLHLGPWDTKEKSSHVPAPAFPGDPEAITEKELRGSFPLLGWICSFSRSLIRRGNADTPEGPRDTSPNSETSTSTTHSVCGEQGRREESGAHTLPTLPPALSPLGVGLCLP